MWPAFQSYAKEKYGYDVSDLAFAEAPFGELFQKIAPTLASGSNEFNLMIVDSQWLGALSEPGWIVKADEVFALNPELDIEPYSSLDQHLPGLPGWLRTALGLPADARHPGRLPA